MDFCIKLLCEACGKSFCRILLSPRNQIFESLPCRNYPAGRATAGSAEPGSRRGCPEPRKRGSLTHFSSLPLAPIGTMCPLRQAALGNNDTRQTAPERSSADCCYARSHFSDEAGVIAPVIDRDFPSKRQTMPSLSSRQDVRRQSRHQSDITGLASICAMGCKRSDWAGLLR